MNTFSSVKKIKSAANWENFFRISLRAVQFASCARRFLKYFSCRSCHVMRTTRWLRNACLPQYFMNCASVMWVLGWSSWLRTMSFTWSVFSSAWALRGLSLPWRLSTVPMSLNFFSNLLMLLIVHPLSGNSVLNCLALDPFNRFNFFIRILCSSASLKTIFTNRALTLGRLV